MIETLLHKHQPSFITLAYVPVVSLIYVEPNQEKPGAQVEAQPLLSELQIFPP